MLRNPRRDERLVEYLLDHASHPALFGEEVDEAMESALGRMPTKFPTIPDLVDKLAQGLIATKAEDVRRSMGKPTGPESKRLEILPARWTNESMGNFKRLTVQYPNFRKLPGGKEQWAKYLVEIHMGEQKILAMCEGSSIKAGTTFLVQNATVLSGSLVVRPLVNLTMEEKTFAALNKTRDSAFSSKVASAILDPTSASWPSKETIDQWVSENPEPSLNPEQQRARALVALADPVACVQGPPGTGKSHFIANAVLPDELEKRRRILVCCQSNAAVDQLCDKFKGQQWCRTGYEENVSARNLPNFVSAITTSHRLVFTTLYHVAKQLQTESQEDWRFDTVVIDEAASAAEVVTFVVLGAVEPSKIVLVGDHKQLQPYAPRQLHALGFGRSFMERFINDSGDESFITLLEQHRMPSPIRELVSSLFYNSRLRDAPEIIQPSGHRMTSVKQRILVLDLKFGSLDYARTDKSWQNEFEAKAVKATYEWLRSKSSWSNDDFARDALVISPFNPHKDLIRREITGLSEDDINSYLDTKKNNLPPNDRTRTTLENIDTVDKFQGSERPLVILSPAVVKDLKRFDDPHLLCVALSRASDLLVIVGRLTDIASNAPDTSAWPKVLAFVNTNPHCVKVTVPSLDNLIPALNGIPAPPVVPPPTTPKKQKAAPDDSSTGITPHLAALSNASPLKKPRFEE